jgi:hypothetical protein
MMGDKRHFQRLLIISKRVDGCLHEPSTWNFIRATSSHLVIGFLVKKSTSEG